ncbi:hypothetical protein CEXT_61041 [Caerostris extrusa]|uniref:Uncharacterized protein n=1 Tax=Caerostris extrusa TaxID=172846 RepID=A0AAV4SJM9_CAEEX|nr:hypothetical protein CEXT_61041 [Caerostris extrusa]
MESHRFLEGLLSDIQNTTSECEYSLHSSLVTNSKAYAPEILYFTYTFHWNRDINISNYPFPSSLLLPHSSNPPKSEMNHPTSRPMQIRKHHGNRVERKVLNSPISPNPALVRKTMEFLSVFLENVLLSSDIQKTTSE